MPTTQTLIVARADRSSLGQIGAIFAESDKTGLPSLIGVTERSLFHFHDLYFHLVTSESPLQAAIGNAKTHPSWIDINQRLSRLVTPYSPDWQSPRDAMAQRFYHWKQGEGR